MSLSGESGTCNFVSDNWGLCGQRFGHYKPDISKYSTLYTFFSLSSRLRFVSTMTSSLYRLCSQKFIMTQVMISPCLSSGSLTLFCSWAPPSYLKGSHWRRRMGEKGGEGWPPPIHRSLITVWSCNVRFWALPAPSYISLNGDILWIITIIADI